MNLGVGFGEMEDYAQALKYLEMSLAITEKHFGPKHPKLAGILMNLGNVYKGREENEKAKEYGDRAYKIMFDQYGPNHP